MNTKAIKKTGSTPISSEVYNEQWELIYGKSTDRTTGSNEASNQRNTGINSVCEQSKGIPRDE
jgi:hypothetical protein